MNKKNAPPRIVSLEPMEFHVDEKRVIIHATRRRYAAHLEFGIEGSSRGASFRGVVHACDCALMSESPLGELRHQVQLRRNAIDRRDGWVESGTPTVDLQTGEPIIEFAEQWQVKELEMDILHNLVQEVDHVNEEDARACLEGRG